MAAELLMEKLNDKSKVLQTLEQQLYQLTGIHAETHVSYTPPPPWPLKNSHKNMAAERNNLYLMFFGPPLQNFWIRY